MHHHQLCGGENETNSNWWHSRRLSGWSLWEWFTTIVYRNHKLLGFKSVWWFPNHPIFLQCMCKIQTKNRRREQLISENLLSHGTKTMPARKIHTCETVPPKYVSTMLNEFSSKILRVWEYVTDSVYPSNMCKQSGLDESERKTLIPGVEMYWGCHYCMMQLTNFEATLL